MESNVRGPLLPREKAALSAAGAELASLVDLHDVLFADWPEVLVDEANHALLARGLKIVPVRLVVPVPGSPRWQVVEVSP